MSKIKRYQIGDLDIVNADVAAGAAIATSKLAEGADFLKRDGSVPWTGNQNANGNKLTNLAAPTNSNDAARLVDIQAITVGLDFKDSVRAASTTNINIASAPASIGSVTLSSNNRILLKAQTTQSQNGIYQWNGTGNAMTRTLDADVDAEVTSGLYVYVEEGTDAGTAWVLTTANPITIGSTALTFAQFSGGGALTTSGGLVQSGNDLSVGTASSSRIVVNANDIDLATTGVVAGTYTKLTVDAYGRITTGATATYSDVGAQQASSFLSALVGLSSNGVIVRTGAGTATTRTIANVDTETTVTNGDGVAGNPTIGLASTAITPGNYQGITFDQKGRATGASDQGYTRNSTSFVTGEVAGGTPNGVLTTFSIANAPIAGSVEVMVNGVTMVNGESFTHSGTSTSFAFEAGYIPHTGDTITLNYRK